MNHIKLIEHYKIILGTQTNKVVLLRLPKSRNVYIYIYDSVNTLYIMYSYL